MEYDYFYMDESEQYQFLQMPWLIIKDEQFRTLSSDAKILYSLLLNRTSLSKKNDWRDELGRVYLIYPVDEIKDDLNCGRDKAIKSMQELTKKGLVETIRRGLGKPNLVYVKNFATSLKYTPLNKKEPTNPVNTQKSEISTSRNRKNRLQEVDISDTSNTYLSNIDSIDTESRSRSESVGVLLKNKNDMTLTTDKPKETILDMKKGLLQTLPDQSSDVLSPYSYVASDDKYNTYLYIIQENIEYANFVSHQPADVELVDELVNCMLDVILTDGEKVKINGEQKNRALVKSQYLKINSQDIEHILSKYREQRHKITHIHNYLKTMLYAVKQEASAWAENAVRADGLV